MMDDLKSKEISNVVWLRVLQKHHSYSHQPCSSRTLDNAIYIGPGPLHNLACEDVRTEKRRSNLAHDDWLSTLHRKSAFFREPLVCRWAVFANVLFRSVNASFRVDQMADVMGRVAQLQGIDFHRAWHVKFILGGFRYHVDVDNCNGFNALADVRGVSNAKSGQIGHQIRHCGQRCRHKRRRERSRRRLAFKIRCRHARRHAFPNREACRQFHFRAGVFHAVAP